MPSNFLCRPWRNIVPQGNTPRKPTEKIFRISQSMSTRRKALFTPPSHEKQLSTDTILATLKPNLPFRQSCLGQKTISYLGPNTWNNLAAETKLRRSVNTFKHDIKKLFFDKLKKQNDDIFFYY